MDLTKVKDAISKMSKDTKDAVRALFVADPNAEEATVTEEVEEAMAEEGKFIEATTEEGNILVIEPSMEVGASVMLRDPDTGDLIETPDASYVLQDGTTIEVAGGEVTAISPAEEVEEEVEEEEAEMAVETEPAADRAPKVVTERTEVEKRFEAENKELRDELNKSNERIETLTNQVEEFKTLLAEFGAMPSEEPVQEPKSAYSPRLGRAIELNAKTKFKTK